MIILIFRTMDIQKRVLKKILIISGDSVWLINKIGKLTLTHSVTNTFFSQNFSPGDLELFIFLIFLVF